MQLRLAALVSGIPPGPDMEVRFAVADDLAALTALDVASWEPALRLGERRISDRLEATPRGCIVLKVAGEIRSALYLRTSPDRDSVVRTPVLQAIDGLPGDAREGRVGDTVLQLLALVTDRGHGPAQEGPAQEGGAHGATLLQHVVSRAAEIEGIETILGIIRSGPMRPWECAPQPTM